MIKQAVAIRLSKIVCERCRDHYFCERCPERCHLAKSFSLSGDFKKAIEVMDEILPVAEKAHHPKLEQYRQFYASLKSPK